MVEGVCEQYLHRLAAALWDDVHRPPPTTAPSPGSTDPGAADGSAATGADNDAATPRGGEAHGFDEGSLCGTWGETENAVLAEDLRALQDNLSIDYALILGSGLSG